MPRKKKIDSKALIKAVESGLPRKEIMAQFGFMSPVQVTTYYLDSLIETGQAKAIVGRRSKAGKAGKAGKESKVITVNKRGSLVIPREKAEELGYKVGDTFSISQTKKGEGISLKLHKA
ncbi:MAG: hypothetical protein JRD68_14880 [Deltaproteobacteria bacterium]|nr:hypothetical protein [Deltaproteobacteria bacterium]